MLYIDLLAKSDNRNVKLRIPIEFPKEVFKRYFLDRAIYDKISKRGFFFFSSLIFPTRPQVQIRPTSGPVLRHAATLIGRRVSGAPPTPCRAPTITLTHRTSSDSGYSPHRTQPGRARCRRLDRTASSYSSESVLTFLCLFIPPLELSERALSIMTSSRDASRGPKNVL